MTRLLVGETVMKESLVAAFPIVDQSEQHTMGVSLQHYIKDKLPNAALPLRPSHVIVRPFSPEEKLPLTSDEKNDKTVNRHRPYSRYHESTNDLEIICVPGTDLIKHYATLAAAYWGLDASRPITNYSLPYPQQCYSWLQASNLRDMGLVDTVVLGYVDRLSKRGPPQTWDSGSGVDDPSRKLFAWQICRPDETDVDSQRGSVAFLCCFFNFWGDIAASLVELLSHLCGVQQVLYIGKAGSLREDDEPNTIIATGCDSWHEGTRITWQNAFSKTLEQYCPSEVQIGSNASVYSPLEETYQWLSIWRDRCQWVDCEVGHFAFACTKLHISFGYLNIISDNVARWHEHGLASELLRAVKEQRKQLLNIIELILDRHLGLPLAQSPTKNEIGELQSLGRHLS